jgi:hypothetical protein
LDGCVGEKTVCCCDSPITDGRSPRATEVTRVELRTFIVGSISKIQVIIYEEDLSGGGVVRQGQARALKERKSLWRSLKKINGFDRSIKAR